MQLDTIIQAARNSVPKDSPVAREILSRLDNLGYAHEYAEPGYGPAEKGIVLSNWNEVDRYDSKSGRRECCAGGKIMERLSDLLEKSGFDIEWEDEWTNCHDCNRLMRTSPDSYGYTPYYVWADDSTLVCLDCAKKDPEEIISQYVNDPTKCVPPEMKGTLAELGFTRWNKDSFEHGFHPGQTDDPEKIAEQIEEEGYPEYVFTQDQQSQFYITFSAWVRGESWIGPRRADLEKMTYAQLLRQMESEAQDIPETRDPPTREELIESILKVERTYAR